MQIKCLSLGRLRANCYLLISKNEIGIIDPGGEPEEILKEINSLGFKVKYIINTHFHFDHTEANEAIREATGAEILIHEKEKSFINFKPDRFIKDKEKITIGDDTLEVIHTPGHTKGGICLAGEKYVFTGDTVFKNGYGRTDLPGGSQSEILNSLQKLRSLLKPGNIICPGHGDSFEIK